MFKHAISEGIKNLLRSLGLSITAIFIITVSLGSVALVGSLWVAVGFSLRQLDNQAVINVFIKQDVSKENIDIMQKDLNEFPPVKEAKFLNQEKYKIIIEDIQGTKDYTDSLKNIYHWTGIVGIILITVFAMISMLIMVNILRIAIYSRRDEIEIMRLVGATNSYIRGPFIAEGVFYNLFASFFVAIIFVPLFVFFSPTIKLWLGVDDLTTGSISLINWLYLTIAAVVFMGTSVGALASFVATQRYLKL